MPAPDVCPQCAVEEETFTTIDGTPDDTAREADATHVCDGCGFRVYEYDGEYDF